MLLEVFNKWVDKKPNEKIPNNTVTNRINKTKTMAVTADKLHNVLKDSIVLDGKFKEGWFDDWARGRLEMEERTIDNVNQLLTSSSLNGIIDKDTPVNMGQTLGIAIQQNAVAGISNTANSFKDGFLNGIFSWFNDVSEFFNRKIAGLALKSWLIWGAVIIVLVTVCYFMMKYIMKKLKQKKLSKINEVSIKYMKYSETDFLSKSKDFASKTYNKGKSLASDTYTKSKDFAVSSVPKFKESLNNGCKYVLKNKGKFIGGGVILGVIEEFWRNSNIISTAYRNVTTGVPGNSPMSLDAAFSSISRNISNANGFWNTCKEMYTGFFSAIGYSREGLNRQIDKGFKGVKSFFGGVFTKDGLSLKGSTTAHFVLYGIAAVILALLIWVAYKIIKKIRARKRATTTEAFIKAKTVAYYLKENTSMSKKDCNKIANFVYNKELAEGDQKNITTATTKKSKISKYLAAGVAALASIGVNLKLSSVLEKVGPVIDDPNFMSVYAMEAQKAAVNVIKERISKEITVEPARANVLLNAAVRKMQSDISAANGDLAKTAEVYYKYRNSPDVAFGIMDKLALRLNIKLFSFKPVQYLYTKLGGNENAKWATFGTYAIIGIILVVLVICLYYIFKFLRKKYKQRRQRAIVSAQ